MILISTILKFSALDTLPKISNYPTLIPTFLHLSKPSHPFPNLPTLIQTFLLLSQPSYT